MTDIPILGTSFLVAAFMIPLGLVLLLYGFFKKRKTVAWFGFSSMVVAVPVLLVVLFIGAVRGLNAGINIASNKGGEIIRDLRESPGLNQDDVDDDDNDDPDPDTKGKSAAKKPAADEPKPKKSAEPADHVPELTRNFGDSLRDGFRNLFGDFFPTAGIRVRVSEKLTQRGVRLGVTEIKKAKQPQTGGNKVSVYVIFHKDFRGPLRMRAFDAHKREMARLQVQINEKAGTARYVDFTFNERANPDKMKFCVLDAL